jgi:uncharacterized membrane protein (UPF0127 family)
MRIALSAGLLLLVLSAGLSGCSPQTPPAPSLPERDPLRGHLNHAQPPLPTVRVWVGAAELTAEIARTEVQIATGMMFRTNLAETAGMLFVFPPQMIGPKNFYMRNCTVPLSAAYIQPDGVIAEIVDLQPGNEVGVQSQSANLQFVLEVPQGWFGRHQIQAGAVVRTERGTLQQSFFPR